VDAPAEHRFYGELALWWPLISPPEEYAEEAASVAAVLDSASIAVRDVLELGSGGGHNAVHLKSTFDMTLVDLSPQMLEVSRRLNPECAHQSGDMRIVRLGRAFDAVFVHDAVDYMTDESDLARAVETAFLHCRPGGVAVFMPDCTRERFEASTDHGGTDGADGRGVRYLEWSWDPDPADSTCTVDYTYVMRMKDGSVRVEHERHTEGLFPRADWMRTFTDAGFDPKVVPFDHSDLDPGSYELFVCTKGV